MYRLCSILIIAGLSSAAAAETWNIKEGLCGDWVGEWNINQNQSTVWLGTINLRQQGSSCESGTGEFVAGNVRVTIVGAQFTAQQSGMSNGYNCAYTGLVRGNQIVGTYVCPLTNSRFNFSINR
jgi:hypothetical protein